MIQGAQLPLNPQNTYEIGNDNRNTQHLGMAKTDDPTQQPADYFHKRLTTQQRQAQAGTSLTVSTLFLVSHHLDWTF